MTSGTKCAKLANTRMVLVPKYRGGTTMEQQDKTFDWLAYSDEVLRQGRNPDYRKVKNNTYLERFAAGQYVPGVGTFDHEVIALRLHRTYVLVYLPGQREMLNSGGWQTVTTQDRINDFSSAYVRSDGKGGWAVASAAPTSHSPERVTTCRTCKGAGYKVLRGYTSWGGKVVPDSRHDCYRCGGTGQATYGGTPTYPTFHDGIVVRAGEVV